MKSTFASPNSALIKFGYGSAVLLWVSSFFLPAALINETIVLSGQRVFLIGIDALRAGMPGWLANPVAAAAMVAGLLHRPQLATALSGVAVALTLSSFYAPALARSQGIPIEQVTYNIGFFLWLAACSLILATSLYALISTKRATTSF